MKFLFPLVLLVIATSLEASGDAIIRIGLKQPHTIPVRVLLMLAGAAILYGYGLTLNLSPLDWGRLIGAYVATFFVVGTDHQSGRVRHGSDPANHRWRPIHRRLCEEVHLNLAYRWFCRLGLDGDEPSRTRFNGHRRRDSLCCSVRS